MRIEKNLIDSDDDTENANISANIKQISINYISTCIPIT